MIFGNLGNMGDMMGKVKKMQEDMKLIKHELNEARFEENSGGIKVIVSGDMELIDLKIDPKVLVNCDAKRLEFLISDSVDKAYTKAKNEAMHKFKKLTGGFSIPGLF